MSKQHVIAGALALALVACAATTDPVTGATLTFAQQTAAFNAKLNTDLASFNTNALADSIAVGKTACGFVSEANGLFGAVLPALAITGVADPSIGATEAVAFATATVACQLIDAADPTAPATPQVATAVLSVLAIVPQIKASLAQANARVAAIVLAPVVPASTSP